MASFQDRHIVWYSHYKAEDMDERKGKEHNVDAVMESLNRQLSEIKEAQIFCFQPAMIPGYGTGNSTELYLEDKTGGDIAKFYDTTVKFVAELNKRPEVAMAYSSYSMSFPQIAVDVDAAKCKRAGISPNDVLDALGSYCGASYVSDFNKFGKVYRVQIQLRQSSVLMNMPLTTCLYAMETRWHR